MNSGILDIDHLLCSVSSSAQAGLDFERLGFTVTPLSRIEKAGVENRLVTFSPATGGVANYIELMSSFDRARLPAPLSKILGEREAVQCLMFGSSDALTTYDALIREGHQAEPVNKYQRSWALPSGEVLQLAFDVVEPMQGPATFGICQHRTLHHYLRSEFQVHPNGAERITSVYLIVPEPETARAFFDALLDDSPQHGTEEVVQNRRGVDLHFLDKTMFARKFPNVLLPLGVAGYEIACRSIAETTAFFSEAGIEFHQMDSGIFLCNSLTHGHLIHFTEFLA